MKLRVLGIDPGLAIVGYGIVDWENNDYKLVHYGCIYTQKDLPLQERLMEIYEEIKEIIEKYKPTHVALEDLFFNTNAKTVIAVAQSRGVILLGCIKKDLSVTSYTPLQVKQGITSYGRANKKDIQNMVKYFLNLEEIPKPDDAADGIAIAITHINQLQNGAM